MPSALASQTIARIQQSLLQKEAASLPDVIKLIEELSGRAFSIPVQELADLISRDTMVTARVIQAANTFGYNPCGVTVTTVSQAIQVVGFNKIRNLALSMLLIENAAHSAHPEAIRESAALSLCSGLLAQGLAATRPGQDAEQAFVFACLRHYGRLLLTTFLAAEFTLVHNRPPGETEAAACVRVFGLTPLDLTLHLFESSRLPRPILRCLQDVPPSLQSQPAATTEDETTAITHFSAALAELVVSPRLGSADFDSHAERLRSTFARRLDLPPDAIAEIVKSVDQNIRLFARSYGTRAVASGVLQRIAERTARAEPQPVLPDGAAVTIVSTPSPSPADTAAPSPAAEAGATAAPADPVAAGALPVPEPPPDPVAVLTECLLGLTELLTASPPDVRAMEKQALQAIGRAFSLRDVIYFRREGSGSTYSAVQGLGKLFDLVRQRPLIAIERRDVFSISLSRKEDVLIRDTSDPKLKPFLPEWLSAAGPVSTFILLPLHNEGGSFGLILGARHSREPIVPNPRELQLMKAIRQHITSARRLAAAL